MCKKCTRCETIEGHALILTDVARKTCAVSSLRMFFYPCTLATLFVYNHQYIEKPINVVRVAYVSRKDGRQQPAQSASPHWAGDWPPSDSESQDLRGVSVSVISALFLNSFSETHCRVDSNKVYMIFFISVHLRYYSYLSAMSVVGVHFKLSYKCYLSLR